MEETAKKEMRGFAALAPERIRELAIKGGRAAHNPVAGKRFGHEWTDSTAQTAGRKGGLASQDKRWPKYFHYYNPGSILVRKLGVVAAYEFFDGQAWQPAPQELDWVRIHRRAAMLLLREQIEHLAHKRLTNKAAYRKLAEPVG